MYIILSDIGFPRILRLTCIHITIFFLFITFVSILFPLLQLGPFFSLFLFHQDPLIFCITEVSNDQTVIYVEYSKQIKKKVHLYLFIYYCLYYSVQFYWNVLVYINGLYFLRILDIERECSDDSYFIWIFTTP